MTAAPQPTTSKTRSPEHPSVGLEVAISRAREFYEAESFNYAPVNVAKRHWGYGEKSSSGMRLLAALLHFNLLEEDGSGSARRVRLTKQAKAILLDRRPDSSEHTEAIRAAALSPKLYGLLWNEWKPTLPSDANMEFDLIQKYGFNPESVRSFIKDFKATVLFAKLAESVSIEDKGARVVGGAVERQPTPPEAPARKDYDQQPGLPMTAVQLDSTTLAPLDMTVPLFSGRRAVLRVPVRLTNIEFDLIRKAVVDQLDMYRAVLTGSGENMPKEP